MKLTAEDFVKLTRQVEDLKRQHDRAAGAKAQVMQELKKKFKCKNLKDAQALVDKLLQEEEQLEEEIGKQMKELRNAYPDVFPD